MEVFEGSTSDPKTVACQVDKIRTRFGLQRVVLVGDRGMLTAARIREDLQGIDGLRWITTLRAPTIRKLLAAGTVTPSLFDERDLAEVSSEQFPGERLIVCRNPLLAAERQRKRQELLAATEKDLTPITAATRRKSQPLCGAAAIGMRVGKVINRHKVAKHFVTTITDDTFTYRRDEDKIAAEEQLDGLYIVRSNVEPEQFDAAQTVRAYKDLSKVERAFRSLKSVDLKVRPIHHRRADRVRAHVLLRSVPTSSRSCCDSPLPRPSKTGVRRDSTSTVGRWPRSCAPRNGPLASQQPRCVRSSTSGPSRSRNSVAGTWSRTWIRRSRSVLPPVRTSSEPNATA